MRRFHVLVVFLGLLAFGTITIAEACSGGSLPGIDRVHAARRAAPLPIAEVEDVRISLLNDPCGMPTGRVPVVHPSRLDRRGASVHLAAPSSEFLDHASSVRTMLARGVLESSSSPTAH